MLDKYLILFHLPLALPHFAYTLTVYCAKSLPFSPSFAQSYSILHPPKATGNGNEQGGGPGVEGESCRDLGVSGASSAISIERYLEQDA